MFCAVAGGNVHNFAITDFEATSARKAYPCFDEPQLKVRLSVSMTAHQPTAGLAAHGWVLPQRLCGFAVHCFGVCGWAYDEVVDGVLLTVSCLGRCCSSQHHVHSQPVQACALHANQDEDIDVRTKCRLLPMQAPFQLELTTAAGLAAH